MMIDGSIAAVRDPLSVEADPALFPNPAVLYIFAAADGNGGFTLSISDSETATTGTRLIGRFCWSGSAVIPGTLKTANESGDPSLCQGRLTVVSGNPVPESDISSAETVYFTPMNGNRVSLWHAGIWETFVFSELSLSLSGLTQGVCYDVFLYADGTGLHLTAQSWGTAGPRPAGSLSYRDGVPVSSGNAGKRYLGSLALAGAGVTADTGTARLIWNRYNRVSCPLCSVLNTSQSSAVMVSGSWIPYFGADAPEVTAVLGSADGEMDLTGVGNAAEYLSATDYQNSRTFAIGICRDMMETSPYTGNENAEMAFLHSSGSTPVRPRVSGTVGVHTYTLACWANYPFGIAGSEYGGTMGEVPGLFGSICG